MIVATIISVFNEGAEIEMAFFFWDGNAAITNHRFSGILFSNGEPPPRQASYIYECGGQLTNKAIKNL